MNLLRRMTELQHRNGAVTDEALQVLARETGTPLYRLQGLRSFYPLFRTEPGPRPLHVCRDIACRMAAGGDPCARVTDALGARDDVDVIPSSCLGRCDHAPAALWEDVPVGGPIEALAAAVDQAPTPPDPVATEWPLDPYAGPVDHYAAARALLGEGGDPDTVIATLEASGLRGMGGAGFPVATKWRATRSSAGTPRTVICNADESEPGTFKDREILAQLPHLVIEAMVIAGWVAGAERGIVYLRHEYGPERRRLEAALDAARAAGALGDSVFGTGFAFGLEIFDSPGGYIMGEETALLEGLEDRRGEPRNKPPFPTEAGLRQGPTLMNNVETFAAVPRILAHGADAWRALGRRGHAGLKVLSVSGDVTRPGVYCVPMGTTIAEVIERAGGVTGGALLGFAPGGASTPFLPATRADTPVDFDALREAGSALGSGALTVFNDSRDLLDLALAQLRFFRNESCGKCVPCRVGSAKAVDLVEGALADTAPEDLIPQLRALDATLAKTSICGLGQVALGALISLLDHFPRAHWQALEGRGERTGEEAP